MQFLNTQSLDKTTKIWNRNLGNLIETLASSDSLSSAISKCGNFEILGNEDSTLTFKDMKTKQAITLIKRHSSSISTLVMSKCGKQVLSAALNNVVILYDLNNPNNQQKYEQHTNQITSVAISPDNKYILTSGLDQKVQLINTFTGKLKYEVTGHQQDIMTVEFSPCGKQFLTAGKDNIGQLYDIETAKLVMIYGQSSTNEENGGHKDWILTSKISPNNKQVVTGGRDRQSILWDLRSGKRLAILNGHKGSVTSIDFSPDSNMIVTASADGNNHVQDIQNKALIYKLEGDQATIWSVAICQRINQQNVINENENNNENKINEVNKVDHYYTNRVNSFTNDVQCEQMNCYNNFKVPEQLNQLNFVSKIANQGKQRVKKIADGCKMSFMKFKLKVDCRAEFSNSTDLDDKIKIID